MNHLKVKITGSIRKPKHLHVSFLYESDDFCYLLHDRSAVFYTNIGPSVQLPFKMGRKRKAPEEWVVDYPDFKVNE